jgi:PTS system maltose and glucose-specific IIC component
MTIPGVVYGLTVPQIREKLEKYLGRDNGGDE